MATPVGVGKGEGGHHAKLVGTMGCPCWLRVNPVGIYCITSLWHCTHADGECPRLCVSLNMVNPREGVMNYTPYTSRLF